MSGDLYRQPERIGVRVFNIDAALVGSVNTAIVLWQSAPVIEGSWLLATYGTYTSTAALGSSFKFTKAGRYECHVAIAIESDDTDPHAVDFALSQDSTNLNNTPQVSSATILDFARAAVPIGAGFYVPVKLTSTIYITDTLAGDPTRGIVRVHAADTNTGGAPTGIQVEGALWRFRWLGDLRG